jgi:hypothetical protein
MLVILIFATVSEVGSENSLQTRESTFEEPLRCLEPLQLTQAALIKWQHSQKDRHRQQQPHPRDSFRFADAKCYNSELQQAKQSTNHHKSTIPPLV